MPNILLVYSFIYLILDSHLTGCVTEAILFFTFSRARGQRLMLVIVFLLTPLEASKASVVSSISSCFDFL